MSKKQQQIKEDIPEFLKRSPDSKDFEVGEKAYALYLKDTKKTPEAASKENTSLAQLLPWLMKLDDAWKEIPTDQMKTSGARKLNHRINSHLHKFKGEFEKVKNRIAEFPDD